VGYEQAGADLVCAGLVCVGLERGGRTSEDGVRVTV
jgi:hypothetical protein